MTMRITPSILNADLADLSGEIGRIPSADGVHIPPVSQTGRLATVRSKGLAATLPSSLRRRTLSPEACSFAEWLSAEFFTCD